ncbi:MULTISPECIES: hypothetical protein [unclassified Methanobrevibacter]|uniref:hypothetical protein n=1 Tax=unclassified Methanobrevibacter TaxID=2638681 RepID=UPI002733BCFC|nr:MULTISPECIES: hypothetical protein [unclassified Methanobrevibacter]
MAEELSYEDIKEYGHLFTIAPSFVLEMMARKNSNIVLKFKSTIRSFLESLSDEEMIKLDLILTSDVDVLQDLMNEAYAKSGKKQYKILANPKYKNFIILNLGEIEKLKRDSD